MKNNRNNIQKCYIIFETKLNDEVKPNGVCLKYVRKYGAKWKMSVIAQLPLERLHLYDARGTLAAVVRAYQGSADVNVVTMLCCGINRRRKDED